MSNLSYSKFTLENAQKNFELTLEENQDLFDEIQYSDPNVDYEKFCENNKQNSLRRSLCTFYINLMKEEVLDIQKIKTLLFKLIDKFNDTVKSEKNGFICEEIVENLFILITEGKEILKNTHDWNDIYEFINNRKSLQVVNNPSFTNKIKFKLMDIYDIII